MITLAALLFATLAFFPAPTTNDDPGNFNPNALLDTSQVIAR